MFHLSTMRFSADQLRDKALHVLEEAYSANRTKAVEPTRALRFALAYLGNEIDDREPFDTFWQAVTGGQDKDMSPSIVHLRRSAMVDGALFRIYQALGLDRPKPPAK